MAQEVYGPGSDANRPPTRLANRWWPSWSCGPSAMSPDSAAAGRGRALLPVRHSRIAGSRIDLAPTCKAHRTGRARCHPVLGRGLAVSAGRRQGRPGSARRLASWARVRPSRGPMRGGEISGLWPGFFAILYRIWLGGIKTPEFGLAGTLRAHSAVITNVNRMTVVNDVQTGAAAWFFVIWDRVGSRGSRSRPGAVVRGRSEG